MHAQIHSHNRTRTGSRIVSAFRYFLNLLDLRLAPKLDTIYALTEAVRRHEEVRRKKREKAPSTKGCRRRLNNLNIVASELKERLIGKFRYA